VFEELFVHVVQKEVIRGVICIWCVNGSNHLLQ
jgi:hypothetical protein